MCDDGFRAESVLVANWAHNCHVVLYNAMGHRGHLSLCERRGEHCVFSCVSMWVCVYSMLGGLPDYTIAPGPCPCLRFCLPIPQSG